MQFRNIVLGGGLLPKSVKLHFSRENEDGMLEKCLYEFHLQTHEKAMQVYDLLCSMQRLAKQSYDNRSKNPIESNFFNEVLELCSQVHTVQPGERLVQVTLTDSLFVVRSGSVKIIM